MGKGTGDDDGDELEGKGAAGVLALAAGGGLEGVDEDEAAAGRATAEEAAA